MKTVFSEEHRFLCIIEAEIALARAEGILGMIPREDADIIAEKARCASLARAKEIEDEIHHDMMAVVRAISEVCGHAGRWIHSGQPQTTSLILPPVFSSVMHWTFLNKN
jgi:adenylosuccinate lyase